MSAQPGTQPVVLTQGLSPEPRDALTRRVRLLVAATIAYNVIEAVVALVAGAAASSSALLGFGLDSVIEVTSALAVAWQFSARDHARREAREQTALRVTACAFFSLAAFVSIDSTRALLGADRAGESTVGILLAGLSLLFMPVLSASQRRAGRALGSASAVADSKQTLLCTYLSAVLLVALLANLAFGWWWADSAAGLIIAVLAVKEGSDAWHGEGCCAPTSGLPVRPGQESVAAGCSCAQGCDCC
jgi:divalent metal cation (Fe/Co/Zn/Cd) transporter